MLNSLQSISFPRLKYLVEDLEIYTLDPSEGSDFHPYSASEGISSSSMLS